MRKRTKALLAFLFVAIVAVAVECMYLCPTRLQVVEHRVALPGWPKDCAETRVVVLSDFHAAAGQREWIERIVQPCSLNWCCCWGTMWRRRAG